MNKRFTKEDFESIYSKVPRICVDLMIRNNNKEFLLTKRKIYPQDIWHLPGGTLFIEESLEECANRVALEELGSKIKILGFKGYIDNLGSYSKAYGRPINMVFEAKLIDSSNKIVLDEQASEFGFFKEIPENTDSGQKRFLRAIKD